MLNANDEQILAQYQKSGDVATLGKLIERHLERVRNLAFRLVLCHAAADDVAQEVFLKVMRGANSFRGEANFSTWLYRITVNTAREHHRRLKPTVALLDNELSATASEHRQPEAQLLQEEFIESVGEALGRLSDKLRTAIVLTAIEGLSAKTAAEIEGCSTATMHWRIHEARKQLKPMLARQARS